MPANGLAASPAPTTKTVDVGPAVVADPMEHGSHLVVSVNRRVDLLEREYAQGHITEAAYHTGREIQNTFERLQALGGSSWSLGDRVDATIAHELAILSKVEKAQDATRIFKKMIGIVGMAGARRLRGHLVEGLTYPQAAAARGQSGPGAITFAAKAFRDLLEEIAEGFAAKGAKSNGRIRSQRFDEEVPA